MDNDSELVTIRLPKKYRDLALEKWSLKGNKFNYSQVIREALAQFLKGENE